MRIRVTIDGTVIETGRCYRFTTPADGGEAVIFMNSSVGGFPYLVCRAEDADYCDTLIGEINRGIVELSRKCNEISDATKFHSADVNTGLIISAFILAIGTLKDNDWGMF